MLTKQLREHGADGLVTRIRHPEIPPRGEHELTPAGKAFIPILAGISDWVTEYCPGAGGIIG